jgi:hypothetical protein
LSRVDIDASNDVVSQPGGLGEAEAGPRLGAAAEVGEETVWWVRPSRRPTMTPPVTMATAKMLAATIAPRGHDRRD